MGKPQVDLLLRKSKVTEQGTNTLSIRDQETRGRRWAKTNGYAVRHVWKENLSGFKGTDRPEQEKALVALLSHETDALWVAAIDRWSRLGAESVLRVLAAKARLVFDYERLDTSNERDRRWIIDRAEEARAFSVRLTTNLINAKAQMHDDGRWPTAAPYGLKADKDRKLRPNDDWPVVEMIYRMGSEGHTLGQIKGTLGEQGIPSPSGDSEWSKVGVRRILIHPVYEGWMTISIKGRNVLYTTAKGKRVRVVKKKHLPRMISEEQATRARRVLRGHQTVPGMVPAGRAKHLLTGKPKCPACKCAMVASGRSFICSTKNAGKSCPEPSSVSRERLEAYVTYQWVKRLSALDPEDPLLGIIAERWTALQQPEETAELEAARLTLKEAQADEERFYADDRAGFYKGRAEKYRMPAKQAIDARIEVAEERIAELSGGESADIGWLLDGSVEEFFEHADLPLRRDLISLAIERVWVRPGKRGQPFDGLARVDIDWVQQ